MIVSYTSRGRCLIYLSLDCMGWSDHLLSANARCSRPPIFLQGWEHACPGALDVRANVVRFVFVAMVVGRAIGMLVIVIIGASQWLIVMILMAMGLRRADALVPWL